MYKSLFDEGGSEFIVSRPEPELLEQIKAHDRSIERAEKFTKRGALLFVLVMAVLWIGGDIAGFSSDLVLMFGLLTIFGFPVIWLFGALWTGRRSVKRRAEELAEKALMQMDIPDDAAETELLFPEKAADDFYDKKGLRFENRNYLVFSDDEALYIADITGTARVPYHRMGTWTASGCKARTRFWLQSGTPSAYSGFGVKKKSSLLSLIPFVGSFIPDQYEIPYSYSIIRTSGADFLLCVPSYGLSNIPGITEI